MSYPSFGYNTSLDTFRQNMTGLQPPHNYAVEFVTEFGYLSTYPDMIQFPDRSIQILNYDPAYGQGFEIPVHGGSGKMLCSFILLDDWKVRAFFEKWMAYIQPFTDYGGQSNPISSYKDCIGESTITFLKNNQITKEYRSMEVYPIEMTPIEFSAGASGYTTFNILFYVRNMRAGNSQSVSGSFTGTFAGS